MRARAAAFALALACTLVPAALALAQSTDAELPVPTDKNAIVMNFENVDLTAFIRFISKVTGRNIVFGDKIEGTVSVVSPTPVNSEQAFAMFQSVLATQGLTTVDEGAVMRIVSIKEARTSGSSVENPERPAAGFTTKLIPLRYVNSGDIAHVLAPQISKDGSIVPYEGTNTVIVSDTASNLARITEMIRVMDIPGHEQVIAVIPLKHAESVRTAEQIIDLLIGPSGGGGGGGRRRGGSSSSNSSNKEEKESNSSTPTSQLGFKITPDERTNSLVVMAPPAEMARIKALAAGLDQEIRPGEERVHVYYSKNADAENLVEVVSGMLLGSKKGGGRAQKGSSNKKDDLTSWPTSNNSSNSSMLQTSMSQNPASSTPPSASDENVSITADLATNAVIVNGPNNEWRTILSLLEKLDIPRPQVFIEAIIIEASATKAKALGFDYQSVISAGSGNILLRSNIADLASAFINPLALGGLVAAAASDKQVQLPDGTEIPANYALLQALNQTDNVEVLSAPTLLTLDNQEAEIVVGQNIPFVTGRASDLAKIENVFTQVERQNVGVKLRVKPQVAEGDIVVLDVQQEVSAVVHTPQTDSQATSVGPTTTIRSATTTVSVGDGRTIVIGGLISNRDESADNRLPLLGDIPWIGRLFQQKSKQNEKVNLIIFLTPHVIRSPRDLDFVSRDRRDLFRAQMQHPETPLPGDQPHAGVDATEVSDITSREERNNEHELEAAHHRAAAPAAAQASDRAATKTTTKSTTVTKTTATAKPAEAPPAPPPDPPLQQ
ncbi:MAG TPA: type II secretion system secretin GspD [Candidatus Binatia bacterium]|jgi:general secretion pathway protein D